MFWATKLQKYYIIVCLFFIFTLQTESIIQKITELKWQSYQKRSYQNMSWAGQKWRTIYILGYCSFEVHQTSSSPDGFYLGTSSTASAVSILIYYFKYLKLIKYCETFFFDIKTWKHFHFIFKLFVNSSLDLIVLQLM